MFAAIAADPNSPWRTIAPYLVARTTIRKATLSGEKNNLVLLAQAEKENAAKKNFFEKGGESSRQQGARATRQRLFQGQTKKRREDITRGH